MIGGYFMGHSHLHGNGHSHGHLHGPPNFNTAFALGIIFNTAFVIVEAVYGVVSHSLTLLADAGHNAGDVLSLLLAWTASALSKRVPSARRTYGYRRSSILAALFNALFFYYFRSELLHGKPFEGLAIRHRSQDRLSSGSRWQE